jgi:hypothetical protein
MAQAVDSGGGAKLVEYRLHLAPDVVAKLKRKALDRSEREGRTIYWSGLVRETLSRLVSEGSN